MIFVVELDLFFRSVCNLEPENQEVLGCVRIIWSSLRLKPFPFVDSKQVLLCYRRLWQRHKTIFPGVFSCFGGFVYTYIYINASHSWPHPAQNKTGYEHRSLSAAPLFRGSRWSACESVCTVLPLGSARIIEPSQASALGGRSAWISQYFRLSIFA